MAALSLDRVTVARRLDADPEHLEQFVVNHPEPTVDVVLRSAVTSKPPRRVSGETRDLLDEWIEHRKDRQHDGPRRWVVEHLREHGPTREIELADLVADELGTEDRNVGWLTVLALERGDCIYTPDDEDGREFRLCDGMAEC